MSLTIKVLQNNGVENNVNPFLPVQDKNGNKSICAGSFRPGDTDSLVEQKRNTAKRQAMKLISDAWEKENKVEENVKEMQESKAQKVAEVLEMKSEIEFKSNDIEEKKKAVQAKYGVDADSQEQKDLELLEKYQNNINGAFQDEFSQEEITRLKELQNMPRTEYQNEVLKLNETKSRLYAEINQGERDIENMSRSIYDTKIEQLKSKEMLKATDAADKVMDAASKEIMGILREDAMENIDEKMEEEQEKAEKAEEEKKEQEERVEAVKEERKEQEEFIQEVKENRDEQEELIKEEYNAEQFEMNASFKKYTNDSVQEAQKTIQRILQENGMINEDLKGIKIDFDF